MRSPFILANLNLTRLTAALNTNGNTFSGPLSQTDGVRMVGKLEVIWPRNDELVLTSRLVERDDGPGQSKLPDLWCAIISSRIRNAKKKLPVARRPSSPRRYLPLWETGIEFVRKLLFIWVGPCNCEVITAPLSQVKSPYPHAGVNPNHITQSLLAVLVGLQVPFLCTETHELGEEMVASYLYQVHLYHWLETNDYDYFLADNDL